MQEFRLRNLHLAPFQHSSWVTVVGGRAVAGKPGQGLEDGEPWLGLDDSVWGEGVVGGAKGQ